jgi:hypothetical protein
MVLQLPCATEKIAKRKVRISVTTLVDEADQVQELTLIRSKLLRSDVASSLMYEHGAILPFPANFRKPK